MSGEAVEIGWQGKRGAEGVPSPAHAGALQRTSSNPTTAQLGTQWGRKRGTQAPHSVCGRCRDVLDDATDMQIVDWVPDVGQRTEFAWQVRG